MSDEIRKEELPDREDVMPKDHELYTPQGGGGGTGSGPIREVAAVGDKLTQVPRKGPDAVVLPQVGPEARVAEALGLGQGPDGGEGVAGVPGRPEASSFRLLMTLGLAGALAGSLLVFVFLWSQPKILAYRAMVIREAVTEVLKGPDHFSSLFLLDGQFVAQVPEGVDTLDLDRVFLGYDESGAPIGFAMEAEGFGFQDIIGLIFGYDVETGQVLGMKVLRHLETPGPGDKIVKNAPFVAEFDGVDAPILGVKPDRNTGDPAQVDMITGATISSKAVIRIINDRIAELGDLLAAFEPARAEPVVVPAGGVEGDE
ncbi:MAG: FMN-binding protein [Gemmatimonadota bacterium]